MRLIICIGIAIGLVMSAVAPSYAGFGAIAFSPSDGIFGYAERYSTLQIAQARALDECRQHEGNDCRIVRGNAILVRPWR
jgi:hypothetical protein